MLHDAGLLNASNREQCLAYENPASAAEAFVTIETGRRIYGGFNFGKFSNLSTEELTFLLASRADIMAHKDPISALEGLMQLNQAKLLVGLEGEKNRAIIMGSHQPDYTAKGLKSLNRRGLLADTVGDRHRRAILECRCIFTLVETAKEMALNSTPKSKKPRVVKAKSQIEASLTLCESQAVEDPLSIKQLSKIGEKLSRLGLFGTRDSQSMDPSPANDTLLDTQDSHHVTEMNGLRA